MSFKIELPVGFISDDFDKAAARCTKPKKEQQQTY